jgi:hypothetical protein
VTRRHNELRDEIADLAQTAYGPSAACPDRGDGIRERTHALPQSLGVSRKHFSKGGSTRVKSRRHSIFVSLTQTPSLSNSSRFLSAEAPRDRETAQVHARKLVKNGVGNSIPLFVHSMWHLGKEVETLGFLKRVAHKPAIKWHNSYSVVMGFGLSQL